MSSESTRLWNNEHSFMKTFLFLQLVTTDPPEQQNVCPSEDELGDGFGGEGGARVCFVKHGGCHITSITFVDFQVLIIIIVYLRSS